VSTQKGKIRARRRKKGKIEKPEPELWRKKERNSIYGECFFSVSSYIHDTTDGGKGGLCLT
jgi:hypothetical protein